MNDWMGSDLAAIVAIVSWEGSKHVIHVVQTLYKHRLETVREYMVVRSRLNRVLRPRWWSVDRLFGVDRSEPIWPSVAKVVKSTRNMRYIVGPGVGSLIKSGRLAQLVRAWC